MSTDWLTAPECAELCGVHIRCLQKWHEAGVGPPHYATSDWGRRYVRRYLRAEVIEWREKHLRRNG